MSLALHLTLGPQKTPPDAEFRNPADFVNQLVFLACVLPFIPHRAIFRFPVRVKARRKCGNGKGNCVTSRCRNKFHLLALELPKVTLLRVALLVLHRIPSIPGRFGTAHQFNEERATA